MVMMDYANTAKDTAEQSSTTNTTTTTAGSATTTISQPKCPLCGMSPVMNEICPGACGSLEGILLLEEMNHKCRTFGFDWANGYVAPFLGIDRQAVQEALTSAQLQSKDTMVDLGCGDGRICHLASAMGACQAIGYDLDESLIEIAKQTTTTTNGGGSKASFCIGNLFDVGLEPFSIITMFLLPETTDKLSKQLQQALSHRSDLRIIAFGWPIPSLGQPVASYTNKTGSLLDKWHLYANPEFTTTTTTSTKVNPITVV